MYFQLYCYYLIRMLIEVLEDMFNKYSTCTFFNIRSKIYYKQSKVIIIVLLPNGVYSGLQNSCHECGLRRKMSMTNQKNFVRN